MPKVTEYAGNLATSLRAGARIAPDEAATAVLPLVEALVADHQRGVARGVLDPAYVAPEVAEGQQPTAATDVWSVGALLFHAMAGHTPFKHSSEQPARLRRAGWLGPLVEIALSPRPEDRPSMAEVAAYLRARQPLPVPAPQPSAVVEAADVATDDAAPLRRTGMLVLVLAAVVVTLALVTSALVLGRHTARTPLPAPSAHGGSTAASHHHRRRPQRPTTEAMESFARRYVATASSDPGAGLRMLTPAYQRASPRYRQFWSAVRNPRILRISAQPAAMVVTYTYRYRLVGGRPRTETVTLDLARHDGRLMIAGAR